MDPANSDLVLSLGIALIADSQPKAAIAVQKRYIALKPRDFRGYAWLARAYKDLAQYQQAARALNEAFTLNGTDYDVCYNLGVVLIHLGNLAEAAEKLECAKMLAPETADAHYQLANVLRRLGQANKAAAEMEAFQNLKLQEAQTLRGIHYHNKGDELLSAGEFEQAAGQYQQALTLDPKNPRLHYNLSLALAKLGDAEGQEQELKKAIQIDPNLAPAYCRLGQLYHRRANLKEAEQALQTAIEIDPELSGAQECVPSLPASPKGSP